MLMLRNWQPVLTGCTTAWTRGRWNEAVAVVEFGVGRVVTRISPTIPSAISAVTMGAPVRPEFVSELASAERKRRLRLPVEHFVPSLLYWF